MKTKILWCCIFSLMTFTVFGQTGQQVTLKTKTGNLAGTLLVPKTNKRVPVALFIPGSGPVNRNGNENEFGIVPNDTRMLADSLYAHGIASLRYDKRDIGGSIGAYIPESKLRFSDFIQDAEGWVKFLKQNKKFNAIVIIGHSQGSTVGMVAAQQKTVAKYISLEGPGEPIYVVLRHQLQKYPKALKMSEPIMDSLMKGKTVDSIPPMLHIMFRPSIQPFYISYFHYNPQTEIKKLHKPVLIVQGTNDHLVSVNDAKNLAKAYPQAKLVIIQGMNHILKNGFSNRVRNAQTWREPNLPLNKQLVKVVVNFIKK